MTLSPQAVDFINRFQGGFPIVERPYLSVAAKLGITETVLIQTIAELLQQRVLSRFGPLYDAVRLGGGVTLAALASPDEQFDQVAAIVNQHPLVAHNYRRDHQLNMWFVVASDVHCEIETCLADIGDATGLAVYNFPKLREFYLGLWLSIDGEQHVSTVPVPQDVMTTPSTMATPSLFDRQLIAATQTGLPLLPRPYLALAEQLDVDEFEVMSALSEMRSSGAIRRIGAIPNHYALGLRGNGMTVWNVPDERVAEIGERIGQLDYVSHCYERPRYPGVWPYNLFAMVHGRDRDEVLAKTDLLAAEIGDAGRSHDVLFSSAVLKKTGLRVAA